MPSPAGAFKTAQDAALRASTALASAMATGGKGILTEVPVNQSPPYVVTGDDQVLLNTAGCAGDAEIFATVSWWSLKSPRDKGAQARAMGAAIVDALNAQLTVTGWDVDEWEVQDERYSTDPDQSTHGTATFHYLLTEQT